MKPVHPQLPLGVRLDDRARFGNFHAGPNAEAVGAFRSLLDHPDIHYLYCSGAAGAGKSHLLQALCSEARHRGLNAWYLPLDDTLRPDVLEGLEQADLLCLDDLDRIAGQSRWEQALFHLYNRIRDRDGRLVVAGTGRPEELGLELPDLVSRLHWGPLYRLRELGDGERIAALQLRARSRGLELPDETAEYLLRRCPRDLPGLFGMLDRLDEASLVAQRRLTIPFVKEVLGL